MAIFYHIYISPKMGITPEQVQKKMDLAIDWYRLEDTVWIVQSTSDLAKWQTRLRPLVDPGGFLFICKLDVSQRQGWMPKKFWEWFRDTS